MKVTLIKDVPKTVGLGVWMKGTVLEVTPEFGRELVERGDVESDTIISPVPGEGVPDPPKLEAIDIIDGVRVEGKEDVDGDSPVKDKGFGKSGVIITKIRK